MIMQYKTKLISSMFCNKIKQKNIFVVVYLFSYKSVDSKAEKVSGFISLFSLNLYKLQCIFNV